MAVWEAAIHSSKCSWEAEEVCQAKEQEEVRGSKEAEEEIRSLDSSKISKVLLLLKPAKTLFSTTEQEFQ